MTRLARPADRIATGTARVARRLAARAAAWCARGRRGDLTGWRAVLGIVARIALLGLGLYLLVRLVRALPALMWPLAAGWLAAAWRAGRAPAEAVEEPEGEAPAADPREAVRALLLEVMGDAPAVHLRTVLEHLRERGQWEGRKVSDLRARLERLEVPVHRGVKVGGVPTWGVRRRDLEAPSPAAVQETPVAPSTAA
ncbi:hypothetical protein [Streptomyces griseoviridis]|uniref:Uncharacterized protein n=1 Tax=Streptomyces griseoviridis TaxID=45398 RepID=A0ABT9LFA0_STRGD|nr:hypothetical protein [Streptomyces griseoviridis]MDP9682380.1 hypothetical protein [Streptomyces griseoviridis]GGS81877.1 hypothetical protein GCM10010240_14060 [Streptomyces griseoviridis]